MFQTTWNADFPGNVFDAAGAMWMSDGRLVSSQHARAALPVAYQEKPSPSEVRALVERFRMVRGHLPTTVMIVKLVDRSLDDAAFLAWALSRRGGVRRVRPPPAPEVHEEVRGFNVVLCGQDDSGTGQDLSA